MHYAADVARRFADPGEFDFAAGARCLLRGGPVHGRRPSGRDQSEAAGAGFDRASDRPRAAALSSPAAAMPLRAENPPPPPATVSRVRARRAGEPDSLSSVVLVPLYAQQMQMLLCARRCDVQQARLLVRSLLPVEAREIVVDRIGIGAGWLDGREQQFSPSLPRRRGCGGSTGRGWVPHAAAAGRGRAR